MSAYIVGDFPSTIERIDLDKIKHTWNRKSCPMRVM